MIIVKWKNYRVTATGYESLSRSYISFQRGNTIMSPDNKVSDLEQIQIELQQAFKEVPGVINLEDDISSELGENVVWLEEKEKQLLEYDV